MAFWLVAFFATFYNIYRYTRSYHDSRGKLLKFKETKYIDFSNKRVLSSSVSPLLISSGLFSVVL